MVYRRRRMVVEDGNPLGAILAVLAIVLLLFLAWMLFSNNGFGGRGADERETTTQVQQDQPDVTIVVPGGDEPATGEVPRGGGGPPGSE